MEYIPPSQHQRPQRLGLPGNNNQKMTNLLFFDGHAVTLPMSSFPFQAGSTTQLDFSDTTLDLPQWQWPIWKINQSG